MGSTFTDQVKQWRGGKKYFVPQLVEPDGQVGEGDAVRDGEAEDEALSALVAQLTDVGVTLLTGGVPQL